MLQLCNRLTVVGSTHTILVNEDIKASLGRGTKFTVTTATQVCSFTVKVGGTVLATASKIEVDTGYSCPAFAGKAYALALAGTSPEVFVTAADRKGTGPVLNGEVDRLGNWLGASPNNLLVYNIKRLTKGQQYYVRVTAHNHLGYGTPADALIMKPYRAADAPALPVVLRVRDSSIDADERGTSVEVAWNKPSDDGGDAITKYMVEWSREPFTTPNFVKVVQTIKTTSSTANAAGEIMGSFRLQLDTTCAACKDLQIRENHQSAEISSQATAREMTDALQNMHNVGSVTVVRTQDSAVVKTYTWTVTFDSEVGRVPALIVHQSGLKEKNGNSAPIVAIAVTQLGSTTINKASNYCGGVTPAGTTVDCPTVAVTAGSGTAFKHVIYGLVPAQSYYVRVSAFNAAGYGTRRPTTPAFVTLPKQLPGSPVSPYNAAAKPVLKLGTANSLVAQFAPPTFDGGDTISQYKIEWDTSPKFTSGASGTALGHDFVDVGNMLCQSCVTSPWVMCSP